MNLTRRDFLSTGALAAAALPLVGCASSKKETQMPSPIIESVDTNSDYFS
ncbi:MAG: twin-arginine translocation signal domain-containing protein, partial [Proteobacteria bacterium]|nr:twin-arginine translocation signal domain-containing protein [Pseudomonadota bacterium]